MNTTLMYQQCLICKHPDGFGIITNLWSGYGHYEEQCAARQY